MIIDQSMCARINYILQLGRLSENVAIQLALSKNNEIT